MKQGQRCLVLPAASEIGGAAKSRVQQTWLPARWQVGLRQGVRSALGNLSVGAPDTPMSPSSFHLLGGRWCWAVACGQEEGQGCQERPAACALSTLRGPTRNSHEGLLRQKTNPTALFGPEKPARQLAFHPFNYRRLSPCVRRWWGSGPGEQALVPTPVAPTVMEREPWQHGERVLGMQGLGKAGREAAPLNPPATSPPPLCSRVTNKCHSRRRRSGTQRRAPHAFCTLPTAQHRETVNPFNRRIN